MNKVLILMSVMCVSCIVFSGNPYINRYDLQYIENGSKIGTIYSTTVDNLRLRDSQTLDAKIIRNLKKGEKVSLLIEGKEEIIGGDKGRWVKIRTEAGEKGWCFDAFLHEEKQAPRKGETITVQSELLGIEFSYPAAWGTFYSVLWEEDNPNGRILYAFFITTENVTYENLKNFNQYLLEPEKAKIRGGTNFMTYYFDGLGGRSKFDDFFSDTIPYEYFSKQILTQNKASAFLFMKHEDLYYSAPRPADFIIQKHYFLSLPFKKVTGIMFINDFLSKERQDEMFRLAGLDLERFKNPDGSINSPYNRKLEILIEQTKNGMLSDSEKQKIAEYDTFFNSIKIIR